MELDEFAHVAEEGMRERIFVARLAKKEEVELKLKQAIIDSEINEQVLNSGDHNVCAEVKNLLDNLDNQMPHSFQVHQSPKQANIMRENVVNKLKLLLDRISSNQDCIAGATRAYLREPIILCASPIVFETALTSSAIAETCLKSNAQTNVSASFQLHSFNARLRDRLAQLNEKTCYDDVTDEYMHQLGRVLIHYLDRRMKSTTVFPNNVAGILQNANRDLLERIRNVLHAQYDNCYFLVCLSYTTCMKIHTCNTPGGLWLRREICACNHFT